MMAMVKKAQADWITTKEAADLTGYSASYFRNLIRWGRLQAEKRGRDWFLDKEQVLAYKREMEQLGSAKHDPRRNGVRKTKD